MSGQPKPTEVVPETTLRAPAVLAWSYLTPATLSTVGAAIDRAKVVAVDTEFVRDRTYFPELGLVQIAIPGHDHDPASMGDEPPDPAIEGIRIWLVDPLDPQCAPVMEMIAEVMTDRAVSKVMHGASQDIAVIRYAFGVVPTNVFDTQIAAAVHGIGDQVGYAGLVAQLLGASIPKDSQREDWLRRPIPRRALDYAAADVAYLPAMATKLEGELHPRNRLSEARDRFDAMVSQAARDPSPDELASKVKGYSRLNPHQKGRLRGLVAWRDNEARRANLPRRWVLEDDVLLALARVGPEGRPELADIAALPSKARQRWGDELLQAMRAKNL